MDKLQRRLFSGSDVSIGAITAVSTFGYIFWSLRGGVLMAAALSHMPNWCLLDPLPLLESYNLSPDENTQDSITKYFDKKLSTQTSNRILEQHTHENVPS